MHPREQKGVCSGLGGFLHMGQDLALGCFGISTLDGERRFASQGNRSPDLPRKSIDPAGLALDHGEDCGMGDEPDRAGALKRRSPEQGARFERGAILRQLEQVRARACAHDLKKAEAVDRRSLERLSENGIDDGPDFLPLRFSADGGKVDADRASDPVAKDRTCRRFRSRERQLERRQAAVDIDQGHGRRWRYAQLALGKANDPATRFVEQVGPARPFEPVIG